MHRLNDNLFCFFFCFHRYAKFEAELSGQRLPVNDDDLDGDPIKTAVTLA